MKTLWKLRMIAWVGIIMTGEIVAYCFDPVAQRDPNQNGSSFSSMTQNPNDPIKKTGKIQEMTCSEGTQSL